MRATTKEQGFYSQIFKLVLPIVIQNLLSAAVNSADVVMLNYVLCVLCIFDAVRAMRLFATEDMNLEIGFYVNGMLLG